jgi:hypothetical protein
MDVRKSGDPRPLGPDKYGDVFAMGNEHPGMLDTSTILINGHKHKVPGGIHRGPFMWMDNNGQIYIVHGRKSKKNKRKLYHNEGHWICKVAPRENPEENTRWDSNWECYWHNWEKHTEAYIEFLKFAYEVKFLDE